MDLHEAILGRRTIKDFKPDPVPDEMLERALTAGLWAQNHKLTQPWRFTILGPETQRALAEETGEKKILSKPAIVAVGCLVSDDEHEQWEDDGAVACAIQNIQLAAWAEGLGMQWSTGKVARAKATYKLLGIRPKEEKIAGLLFFGFPARVPEAQPRKPLAKSRGACLEGGGLRARVTPWPFHWRIISTTFSARRSADWSSPIARSPRKAGLPVDGIQRLRTGDFDAEAAGVLATALGLNARALVEIGEKAWAPREVRDFNGLAQFNTAFGDMTVNAYLVWDEETKEAAAFDTGGDATELLAGAAPARAHAEISPAHAHAWRSRVRSRPGAGADGGAGVRLGARAAGGGGADRAGTGIPRGQTADRHAADLGAFAGRAHLRGGGTGAAGGGGGRRAFCRLDGGRLGEFCRCVAHESRGDFFAAR